jgi:hypothetical protein
LIAVIAQHVPDISTFSGLCDIMALGNVCELGVLFQRGFYEAKDLDPMVLEECASARWRYRQFQTSFTRKYTIIIDGEHITPHTVFHHSLLEFMAAITCHELWMGKQVSAVPNLTSKTLVQVFTEFIALEYPELLMALQQLIGQHHSFFYWTGPRFEVELRKAEGPVVEQMDFKDIQLYSRKDVQSTQAQTGMEIDASDVGTSSKKQKSADNGSECVFIEEWDQSLICSKQMRLLHKVVGIKGNSEKGHDLLSPSSLCDRFFFLV